MSPRSDREQVLPEHPGAETRDDDGAFLQSLADMVERVNMLVRRQQDERHGSGADRSAPEWADTEAAALDPVDEEAAAAVAPYGIDLALDLDVDVPVVPDPAPAAPLTPDDASPARPSPRRRVIPALVAALLALVVAGTGALWLRHSPGPVPVALPLDRLPPTAAAPTLPPPARARWQVAIDAEASTESTMAAQLAQAVAADGEAFTFAGDGGSAAPTLGIARYDALQAQPGRWGMVAPLATEEVYALVRADSPLRFLHELRGRRIDIGAPGSARAQSGAALYRRLFGAAPAADAATALPRDAALQALLAGGELDAVLLFDGQPSTWLAGLPDQTRRRLRLLALAPADPASRRALQAYLPARVAPLAADGAGGTLPTLGVVAFLVAAAPAPDAGPLAHALCTRLSDLRRTGHPKWREVQPALQLPVGLPAAPGVAEGLRDCGGAPTRPSPPTATPGVRP